MIAISLEVPGCGRMNWPCTALRLRSVTLGMKDVKGLGQFVRIADHVYVVAKTNRGAVMSQSIADERTLQAVVHEHVVGVLRSIDGVRADRIWPEAHLIDDVGLDSFQFVDVTVALERALNLDHFPMQEWVDESKALGRSLTVQSLVGACEKLLSGRVS